jgi:hypothetical protein
MNTITSENMLRNGAGHPAESTADTVGAGVQECLNEVDAAYLKGDLPAACEILQRGLQEAPENPALLAPRWISTSRFTKPAAKGTAPTQQKTS